MSVSDGVAVIIAARNPGSLLGETLDSVAAQTHAPLEVLVVDDGSSDDSVARAAKGRSGVTTLRIDPSGRSVARNTGARASAAGLLLFLDADDLLVPEALELLCAAIDSDETVDMVHGLIYEFVDDRDPPVAGSRSTNQVLDVRLGGCTLLRRTLWDRAGGLDASLRQGEWIEWMVRATAAARAIARVDSVVLHRRLHGGNGTASTAAQSDYLSVARAALLRKRQAGGGQ